MEKQVIPSLGEHYRIGLKRDTCSGEIFLERENSFIIARVHRCVRLACAFTPSFFFFLFHFFIGIMFLCRNRHKIKIA
jgi:hypothetical protein